MSPCIIRSFNRYLIKRLINDFQITLSLWWIHQIVQLDPISWLRFQDVCLSWSFHPLGIDVIILKAVICVANTWLICNLGYLESMQMVWRKWLVFAKGTKKQEKSDLWFYYRISQLPRWYSDHTTCTNTLSDKSTLTAIFIIKKNGVDRSRRLTFAMFPALYHSDTS